MAEKGWLQNVNSNDRPIWLFWNPSKENEPQGTHFTISDSKFSDAFGYEDKGEGNYGSNNDGIHGMSHTNDSAYIHIIIIAQQRPHIIRNL